MNTGTHPAARKIRVLIVDDSLFMRAAIARALAGGPFEIVGQAKDGHDALAQIQKLTPDVVTMDFNMPGMTGADAVRLIMQQRPTPVVMFSAHTRQGAKETFDALAAGAVDFMTKPAGEVSVDLTKIADELVRSRPAARPRSRSCSRRSGPICASRSSSSSTCPPGSPGRSPSGSMPPARSPSARPGPATGRSPAPC
jgi:two-component system chemotaxis response regulator CheB